jgi:sugar-specific transcriptional regulator TrmB
MLTNVKESEALHALGLDDEEVKTYVTLLAFGPSSIRKIAAESGINRGSVYEAIKRLVSLGLVRYFIKNKRRRYFAEQPDRITALVEERQKELSAAAEQIQELIPQLKSLSPRRIGEPIVRFYEDDEGVVAILRDVLATVSRLERKEYYVYSSRPLRKYLYNRFPNFTRRRLKEGLFVKVIAIGEGGDPIQFAERKWLKEPENERLSSYVIIYGNKVALISVSPDDTPYGVVIEEPGVAATQKYLFQKLWESLD